MTCYSLKQTDKVYDVSCVHTDLDKVHGNVSGERITHRDIFNGTLEVKATCGGVIVSVGLCSHACIPVEGNKHWVNDQLYLTLRLCSCYLKFTNKY